MIRVVVVDDETLVRSGLSLIVGSAPDIEVVATCSGGEAVDAVVAHEPQVVLLDIRMPDVDGLTVLRALRELPGPPAVAMLTTFDTDEYIGTALRAGAAGFLLKDAAPQEIVDAVEAYVVDSAERERSTASVGELIMARLKEIDTVAYIRFASVYRDFKDVNEFKEELEGLLGGKDSKRRAMQR